MPNAYVVIEPEQVVAQDLAHAIRAFDPDAEVHVIRAISDAETVLPRLRPVAIFLHQAPERGGDAEERLKLCGVPLVHLGTLAEARQEGETVLASPFTEATVAALLRRLPGRSDDPIAEA